MASPGSSRLTASDLNRLNRGKKRKVSVENWNRNVKKERRNKGEPYIGHKGQPKPGKLPPEKVSAKTLHTTVLHFDFPANLILFLYWVENIVIQQTLYIFLHCINKKYKL